MPCASAASLPTTPSIRAGWLRRWLLAILSRSTLCSLSSTLACGRPATESPPVVVERAAIQRLPNGTCFQLPGQPSRCLEAPAYLVTDGWLWQRQQTNEALLQALQTCRDSRR